MIALESLLTELKHEALVKRIIRQQVAKNAGIIRPSEIASEAARLLQKRGEQAPGYLLSMARRICRERWER